VIVVAKATPDSEINEKVLQESCRFRSMDDHSILLKQSVPFIVFQWSNELGQNM
jgi:hypothetical protein